MTRLVLVRHGQSQANVEGIFAGARTCTGLSPAGVAQVEALRDRLVASGELADASVLISSDVPRALATAPLVASALGDLEIVADPGWAELDAGAAEGMTWDELRAAFGAPDLRGRPAHPLAPGGESWVALRERVRVAVGRIMSDHEGETVVVATHAGAVEAVVLDALGLIDTSVRIGLRAHNASLTECVEAGGALHLVTFNDRSHLAAGVALRNGSP